MTPQDDAARIQALIGKIAECGDETDDKLDAKEYAEELVQVATAAAYRHAAVYCQASADAECDQPDQPDAQHVYAGLAQFFESWAEKAEAQQEPKP